MSMMGCGLHHTHIDDSDTSDPCSDADTGMPADTFVGPASPSDDEASDDDAAAAEPEDLSPCDPAGPTQSLLLRRQSSRIRKLALAKKPPPDDFRDKDHVSTLAGTHVSDSLPSFVDPLCEQELANLPPSSELRDHHLSANSDICPPSPLCLPASDPRCDHNFAPPDRLLIRLAHLLDHSNAQLCLMDGIVKIFKEEAQNGLDLKRQRIKKRESFFNKIQKRYPVPKPIFTPLTLEGLSSPGLDYSRGPRDLVHLVHCHFVEQWNDLHSDLGIWGNIDNLCVDRDNPFSGNPGRQDGTVDEVVDGKMHQDTRRFVIDNLVQPGEPFIIDPICCYVDKCGTDTHQRWPAEPFLFTSLLIKRELRNKASSWRPLGFLPDLEHKSSAQMKQDRSKKRGRAGL